MSWPVRSRQLGFFSAAPSANTWTDLYTTPSGKTGLLKDWVIYNDGASSRTVYLAKEQSGTRAILGLWVLGTGQWVTAGYLRTLVIPAAAKIRFNTTTAQVLTITVDGAELG